MSSQPMSPRRQPVHPGRRAGHRPERRSGHRAVVAAVAVESWVTDLNTAQRLSPQPVQAWESGTGPAGSTVVVDPKRRYQTMTGFGASMTIRLRKSSICCRT